MPTDSIERKRLFIAWTGVSCGLLSLAAFHSVAAKSSSMGLGLGLLLGFLVTLVCGEEF